MAVNYIPFEAEHGFKSPGFTVDAEGNVTLKSLTYSVVEEAIVDNRFYMRQQGEANSSAFIENTTYSTGTQINEENPSFSLIRGAEFSFSLANFPFLTFNIFYADPSGLSATTINGLPVIFYSDGLTYEDSVLGTLEGVGAQGKSNGIVTFKVPALAPDTLYYATGDGSIYGTITTADPTITGVGAFSSLNVIGDVTFTGQDAEIQIAPQGAYSSVLINPVGQGTMSNMYVNALTLSATDTVNLSPVDKNVTISPSGTGQLVVNSGVAGSINNMSIGQTTARDGSFLALNASNGLNSTVIGNVTPADATFTKAIGQQRPVTEKELTNKAYVDSTATALAIALGV
tara:strand:- start:4064 stop:5095 length:1032 start_codon:yes stop_codon:yes gene_type:complete